MKRLSSTITQKHLRTLAVRHGMQESSNAGEKIESPLMKVDSSGNISCVICRTPLKSASIWKVHVNSKAHKNNVQTAKELKTKILNTNSSRKNVQTEVVQRNITPKTIDPHPVERKSNKPIVKELEIAKNTQTIDVVPPLDPLPLTFFDSAATDTKAHVVDSKDTEWELFQKEIKEVSEAPNEIFVGDQKDLAVEKEIVEIDEQIQHWSKVLDLEEKRKNLNNVLIGKTKTTQRSNIASEESSEGEDFEEYPDWRSKVFK